MKIAQLLKFYEENENSIRNINTLIYRIVIYPDGEWKIEWDTKDTSNFWQYEVSFMDEKECRKFLEQYFEKNIK